MNICDYGCGQEAIHQFKNGKYCCSKNVTSCPQNKKLRGENRRGKLHSIKAKEKMRIAKLGEKNRLYGKNRSEETKRKIGQSHRGKVLSDEIKRKISKATKKGMKKKEVRERMIEIGLLKKLTIEKLKERYPFFSKIEEMRYNPDNPNEKEVQVHCKNHNCPNSKEQGGWFTPSYIQLYERIRQLEHNYGKDGCYLYCSNKCKQECPLYNLKVDPFKETKKSYTQEEYQLFREYVLERDNHKCQYCGEKAEHVHHERPQKLEPFFALDPDYAWSVCKECHYKFGHKTGTECCTGSLANKIC